MKAYTKNADQTSKKVQHLMFDAIYEVTKINKSSVTMVCTEVPEGNVLKFQFVGRELKISYTSYHFNYQHLN